MQSQLTRGHFRRPSIEVAGGEATNPGLTAGPSPGLLYNLPICRPYLCGSSNPYCVTGAPVPQLGLSSMTHSTAQHDISCPRGWTSLCFHVAQKSTVPGEGPRWLGEPNKGTSNQALIFITPDRQRGVPQMMEMEFMGDCDCIGTSKCGAPSLVFVMTDVQILNLDLSLPFLTRKFRHWSPKVPPGSIRQARHWALDTRLSHMAVMLESMHLRQHTQNQVTQPKPHLASFRRGFPTSCTPQIASTQSSITKIYQQVPVFSTSTSIEGAPILAVASAWWLMQVRLDNSVGMHAISLVNTPTILGSPLVPGNKKGARG